MKIYVCVDCQNDFIDGALKNEKAQIAVFKICKTLWNADHIDDFIFLTQDTHFKNYLETQEGKNLPVPHCLEGSFGWAFNDEIADAASDFINENIITKQSFGSLDLAAAIHQIVITNPIDEIVFMGFCTDICVISNALIVKTVCPEILIKVIADCCAGVSPEKHAAALEVMRSCQIEIV